MASPLDLRLARSVLGTEIRGLLRDRRALFSAFLLPALLYPLIFLGQRWLERTSRASLQESTVRVAVDLAPLGAADARRLRTRLEEEWPIEIVEVDAAGLREAATAAIRWEPPATPPLATEAERQAAVRLASDRTTVILLARALPEAPGVGLRLYFDGTSDLGNQARTRVGRALEAIREDLRAERLRAMLGEDPARGLAFAAVDVASPADAGGALLGRLLPLLAVLVILSGGSYAALAAFAGEREAGTLETLLVQPVPSISIVAAKFTAVLLAGFAALVLNAGSVLVCLRLGLGALPGAPAGAIAVGVERLTCGAIVFLPAAVLLCAVLCLVCGRARTFREGQQTLLPLLIVALVPVALSTQDVELDPLLAAVPLAGPALALRDALRGDLHPGIVAWMCLANALWAGLALRALARRLDGERLLLTPDVEVEASLRQVQSRYALRWAWVAVFVLYIAGGTLQAWNLPWGLFATLWLMLLPLSLLSARGTARRAGESVPQTLGLRSPRIAYAAAGILLAPPLAVVAERLFEWQKTALPLPSSLEDASLLAGLTEQPMLLQLFLLALSPAICEELFFRGALLSGLRRDLGTARCIAWEAMLFGAAHASIYRFLPTAFLGAVLTMLALRSRSLLPAILLHAAYNSAIVLQLARPELTWLAVPGGLLILWADRFPRIGKAPKGL